MAVQLMPRPAPIPASGTDVGAAPTIRYPGATASSKAASSSSSIPMRRRSARLLAPPEPQSDEIQSEEASSSSKVVTSTRVVAATRTKITSARHQPYSTTAVAATPKSLKKSNRTTTNKASRPRKRRSASAPDALPNTTSSPTAGSDNTEEEEESPRARRAMKKKFNLAIAEVKASLAGVTLLTTLPAPAPIATPVQMGVRTRSSKRKSLEMEENEDKAVLLAASGSQSADEDAPMPRALRTIKKRKTQEGEVIESVVQPQPQPQVMTRSRERALSKETTSPAKSTKATNGTKNSRASRPKSSDISDEDMDVDRVRRRRKTSGPATRVVLVRSSKSKVAAVAAAENAEEEVRAEPEAVVVPEEKKPAQESKEDVVNDNDDSLSSISSLTSLSSSSSNSGEEAQKPQEETEQKIVPSATAVEDAQEAQPQEEKEPKMVPAPSSDVNEQELQEKKKVEPFEPSLFAAPAPFEGDSTPALKEEVRPEVNQNDEEKEAVEAPTTAHAVFEEVSTSTSTEEAQQEEEVVEPSARAASVEEAASISSSALENVETVATSSNESPVDVSAVPSGAPAEPEPSSYPSSASAVPATSVSAPTPAPPSSTPLSLSAPSRLNPTPRSALRVPSFTHGLYRHGHLVPLLQVHSPLNPFVHPDSDDADSSASNTPPASPSTCLHGHHSQSLSPSQRVSPPLDAVDLGPLDRLGLPAPMLGSISASSLIGPASPISSPHLNPAGVHAPVPAHDFATGYGMDSTPREEVHNVNVVAIGNSPTSIPVISTAPAPTSTHYLSDSYAAPSASDAARPQPPTPPSPTTMLFATPIAIPTLPANPYLNAYHQQDMRQEDIHQHQEQQRQQYQLQEYHQQQQQQAQAHQHMQQGEQQQHQYQYQQQQQPSQEYQQQHYQQNFGMPDGMAMPHPNMEMSMPMDVHMAMSMGFSPDGIVPSGNMNVDMNMMNHSMPMMSGMSGPGMPGPGMALVSESDLGFGFHGGAGGGVFGYGGVDMQHQHQPQQYQMHEQHMYAPQPIAPQHDQMYHYTQDAEMQHYQQQEPFVRVPTPPPQPIPSPPPSPSPSEQPATYTPRAYPNRLESKAFEARMGDRAPTPLGEKPPEKEPHIWKAACQWRVYVMTRYYMPDAIRSVVAQEAHDYYTQTGVFPLGYNGPPIFVPRNTQQDFQQGSSSGHRVRAVDVPVDDGVATGDGEGEKESEDDFMNEKIYAFELADDADMELDENGNPIGDYCSDEDDDDDDDDDADMEFHAGIPPPGYVHPTSLPSGEGLGLTAQDGTNSTGDEDAEGEMEVDIEAYSDPSFNPDLSSPTVPASPLSPGDSITASFYIPYVNASTLMQLEMNNSSPSSESLSGVMGSSPTPGAQNQQFASYQVSQMQIDQQQPVQPQPQYQHQHPIQIQLPPPIDQGPVSSPAPPTPYILPLPIPKLKTIRVAHLRGGEVNIYGMKGKGTPANRKRGAAWSRAWYTGVHYRDSPPSSPVVNDDSADDESEVDEEARPRLRLNVDGNEDQQRQQEQGSSSSDSDNGASPDDQAKWEAFLAGIEGRSSPSLSSQQVMAENGSIASSPAPSDASAMPRSSFGTSASAASHSHNLDTFNFSPDAGNAVTSTATPANDGANMGGFMGAGVGGMDMSMFDMNFWYGSNAGAGAHAGITNSESNFLQDSSLSSSAHSIAMHSTPPSPTHTSHPPPSLSPPLSPVASGSSTLSFALG